VLPDYAKIKIPANRLARFRNTPAPGYELKLFDARGKLVEKKGITLIINR